MKKKFDITFKREVAQLIIEQGLSIQQVSDSMSVGLTAIRRWCAQYRNNQLNESGISSPLSADQHRIRLLEKENSELRKDVDILKKASAFFAKELK